MNSNLNFHARKFSYMSRSRTTRQRQRGVVLFIALIVLVAMTLAGIGMMRSVDTATIVAGNIGFKQASINSGDSGIETAFQWLLNNAGSTTLNVDSSTNGYYSSAPATDPNWNDPTTWTNAVSVNAGAQDAAGNQIDYIIHRMCTLPNVSFNGSNGVNPQQCAIKTSNNPSASGGSQKAGAVQFTTTSNLYYRITSRIRGPRNTTSYVQVMTMISN